MKTKQLSLDALWESAISQERVFSPDDFAHLLDVARQYLEHAMAEPLLRRIASGTAIANKVLIKMLRAS